ncbi:HAD-IIA family hydrolase [Endozoicomonas ascidiicola]|uniref:HAD-IIA family hydrolase n=1 Tax=Endozoicomonas ascidiicola TaxID=1698521 RepID=UPI000833D0C1|nr:HAD-IIA family hydrolase [Endozoicomonas ascidiicola]
MIVLEPDLLNSYYSRHLDWYPAIKKPATPAKFIAGLADITNLFDLVLLDSYGVLCRGNTPIEDAPEAIQLLRARNIPFCVVSNDTMTNKSTAAEKYKSRGFDFTSHEVLTSLDITEAFLQKNPVSSNVGVIAPMEHPSNALLKDSARLNHLMGHIPDNVDTLLFITGTGWTSEMQEGLVNSAKGRQFELLVGNPDIGAPYGDKVLATPGYFLMDFVERTHQVAKPVLFGKPDQAIFSDVFKSHGISAPSRVLMVGDTLYTDILGGNAMGFKTLLLQCGVYSGQNIEQLITETGIQPDFIAPHL